MTSPQHPRTLTEEEYLHFERNSDTKHEFVNGQVLAMTGASWNHNLICVNISSSLNQQLSDEPCAVVAGDMRLKVATARSFRYPDVMAICDEPEFLDERGDTVVNPSLVFEVASPSTAQIDRNEKRREYRQIATLQAYVLVAQSEARVELY
jgi:Uma2 family endonuclease